MCILYFLYQITQYSSRTLLLLTLDTNCVLLLFYPAVMYALLKEILLPGEILLLERQLLWAGEGPLGAL